MRILEDLNFTIKEKIKIEEKFEEVHATNRKLEEKIKRMKEEKNKMEEEKSMMEEEKNKMKEMKMTMELQLADIVDVYEKKMEKEMKKYKQHAIEKEMHLHYALGAIAILVIIIFATYGISLCTR